MLENTSTTLKSAWFFISRLLILVGMVLFFSSLISYLAVYLCKWIYGYDFYATPGLFNNYNEDVYVLHALKFLQVFITIGAMIIPAWLFPKALGEDPSDFLKIRLRFNPFYILPALALLVISMPMVSWLVELNKGLTFPASFADLEARLKATQAATEELSEAFVKSTTLNGLMVNIFVIALIPAIAEELLFRGALQRFIEFCFNNKHAAVISSAIIFSAFHGEIYAFLPRFVLGVLLGYMFVYSGSIWPSVIVHFTNNALMLFAAHFNRDENTSVFFSDDYRFPFYITIISILLSAAIVYLMYYRHKKEIISNE